MYRQPIPQACVSRPDEDHDVRSAALAESLGITRFFGQTWVVGGHSFDSMADAVAQGRQLQLEGGCL